MTINCLLVTPFCKRRQGRIMIGWGDIYKVVEAMVPLYLALGLGYGSVRWWHFFTPEQCDAINRLVAYFTGPFFTFEFTIHINPFTMNYRVIAADAIAKVLTVIVLAAWSKCSGKSSYCWAITIFSLSQLTNTLVVGAPLFDAMYGRWAQDIVVQLSVVQGIVWIPLLLFALEMRKVRSTGAIEVAAAAVGGAGGGGTGGHVVEPAKDVECNAEIVAHPTCWSLMKKVLLKLVINPNIYASILGVTWALAANRWHLEMPGIVEGSVLIMSKAGAGMAMFSMGLFMALQEKMIACGPKLSAFGMALKFIAGPVAATIGAMAVGLRGDMLKLAIIQDALPQSITSFIFAREYGLHADVLSTGVIFGTLVSLPVLVAYYVVLGLLS